MPQGRHPGPGSEAGRAERWGDLQLWETFLQVPQTENELPALESEPAFLGQASSQGLTWVHVVPKEALVDWTACRMR